MGFFSKIGEIACKVAVGAVGIAIDVAADVYKGVKELLTSDSSASSISVEKPSYSKNATNEEEKKERLRLHNERLSKYQKQIKEKTEKRESNVKEAYIKLYADVIQNLNITQNSEVIKNDLQNYIDIQAKDFDNIMRNEINTKVNPSYPKWKRLMDDENATQEDIDKYTKSVYIEANNHLLDLFSEKIEETNIYIENTIDKYLVDLNKALSEMKDSMEKLRGQKDEQSGKLLDIAKAHAIMQFMQHEANRNLD